MSEILFVDDEENIRFLFGKFFEHKEGYSISTAASAGEALEILGSRKIDLVVTDINMPDKSGMELLREINEVDSEVLVIIITGNPRVETAVEAVHEGAFDYVIKPFTMPKLGDVMERALKKKFVQDERNRLAGIEETYISSLEETLQQQTKEIRKAYAFLQESHAKSLEILAKAADYRDDDTGTHINRIGEVSALLAERLGLAEQEVDLVRHAAPMHDVGKIGIPDRILQKPARLTEEEYNLIKSHAVIGAQIFYGARHPYHITSGIICLTHHEKWNGKGYPQGVAGEDIHLFGRIVAIADVFDALVTKRVYKEAWPEDKALALIREESGQHFDPKITECFLDSVEEVQEIRERILQKDSKDQMLDTSLILKNYEKNMYEVSEDMPDASDTNR